MSTARKAILTAAALLAALALVSILGGSMIWLLGGAHSLDIAGTASETPRPPDTVDVGDGWRHYGGDAGARRYSREEQITTTNVARLAPVWEYRTGDMTTRADHLNQAATEGTPILANGALIFCTPFNEVIAIDPGTGAERWRFDPRHRPPPGPREPVCLPRGQATPMTYVCGGRQYVVIYAGGNARGQGRLGDVVMAFGVE